MKMFVMAFWALTAVVANTHAYAAEVFHACADADGRVQPDTIRVDEPPFCGHGDSPVSWSAPGLPGAVALERVSITVECPPGGVDMLCEVIAECTPPNGVIGGGYSISPEDATFVVTQSSISEEPEGWIVGVANNSGASLEITVDATCVPVEEEPLP